MNKLTIEEIDVRYQNENNYVLKNFSLVVEEKELLVILGNSGCGKSTLLKAISGLIVPEKGKIEFNNSCCFNSWKRHNIPVEKRNIGYCFQNYALCPHMNVYDNLAMPLKARKMKKMYVKQKVVDMLRFIDLHSYSEKLPNNLSGGEKQRVALGRALIYDPTLLLLDEPLTNLDANLKEDLIVRIRNVHDELGITSIYVTHDQKEAFAIADRIAVMRAGKIEQIDTPENIYNNPNNIFVATFIGKNNVLTVDDLIKSQMPESKSHKYIVFRPENTKIVLNSKFRAVIKSIKYLGANYEIVIEYKNQNIMINSLHKYGIKINDEVCFVMEDYIFLDL
ncbi:MAG: ABC transporter ATP-binding protein [Candidatus Izemoplasmatales bacterium]